MFWQQWEYRKVKVAAVKCEHYIIVKTTIVNEDHEKKKVYVRIELLVRKLVRSERKEAWNGIGNGKR